MVDHTPQRFASASLVIFQHTFLPDLFFGDRSRIRPSFRFLLSDTCIADLLANGYTDLNLSDGRFWTWANRTGELLAEVIPDYDKPSKVTPDANRSYELRDCRNPADLEALGTSFTRLMGALYPEHPIFPRPFVPFLGAVGISRNAIANAKRSSTFQIFSSFLPRTSPVLEYRLESRSQSLAHLPIVVEPTSSLRFHPAPRSTPPQTQGSTLRIAPTLRVHLYPYGLTSISLVLNITSDSPFTTSDLISLQDQCTSAKLGRPAALISYGRAFRGTVPEFLDWAAKLVTRAIILGETAHNASSSDLHIVTCLSRPLPLMRARERVGLLAGEPRWVDLSTDYLASFSSFFGRYTGEFVHATPTRLLFCLGHIERRRKRKSRARFRWNFVSIFQTVTSRKLVLEHLESHFSCHLSRHELLSPEVRRRISTWLALTDTWHRRLLRPHRKMFYEVDRVLRTSQLRERIGSYLEDFSTDYRVKVREQVEDYIMASLANLYWLLREKQENRGRDRETWKRLPLPESQFENAAEDLHDGVVHALEPLEGHLNEYEDRIIDLIGRRLYAALSDSARSALVSGETLLDLLDATDDCSIVVIEFAKGAELELNLRLLPRLFALAGERLGRNSFKIGRRVVGTFRKNSLTLGEMPFLFGSGWKGSHTGRLYSNPSYNSWAEDYIVSVLCQGGFNNEPHSLTRLATELQTLAEYRNQAAHMRSISKRDALAVRHWWADAEAVHALVLGLPAKE